VARESANEGIDTVQSSVSYALSANVENLTLTGKLPINGTGNDLGNVIVGNAGANVLNGAAGNDTLTGGGGNDTVNGGDGDDVIFIAGKDAAGDSLSGGDGTDTIQVVGTAAVNLGGLGIGASIEQWHGNGMGVLGGKTSDTLDFSGLHAVTGLAYVDGSTGNDVITGTTFNDDLRGGVGNDTLTGGAGDDVLSGGKGSDVFAYNDFHFGHDTIVDFMPGVDKLSVDHSIDFATVMAHAAQVGADVVFTEDAANAITLQHVALASLHSGDFLFH
jgi:Ca2+-binding RTX toxin-like protein